jgi:site-specific DNA-methyltransferase (adenine-specific)
MVLARKTIEGTVANNVLIYGVGGLNIDGSRVPSDDGFEKAWDKPVTTNISSQSGNFDVGSGGKRISDLTDYKPTGRWPANFIHDGSDEVVALFPSNVKGQVGMTKDVGEFRFIEGDTESVQKFTSGKIDGGSAARFFYCAKASKRDRNEGLDGFEVKRPDTRSTTGMGTFDEKGVAAQSNHHPTVKPTDLMRYLCRLITPPSGIVLDPFMGSGSTGKAATLEGLDFIGIEQSAEYVEIAKARIEWAANAK